MIGAVALLASCGGATTGATLYSGDSQKVAEAIEDLNDTKTNKWFVAAFEKRAAPKEQKRYAAFDYGVAGRPAVNGSTATGEALAKQTGGEDRKQALEL